jgi:hypothetical protein
MEEGFHQWLTGVRMTGNGMFAALVASSVCRQRRLFRVVNFVGWRDSSSFTVSVVQLGAALPLWNPA